MTTSADLPLFRVYTIEDIHRLTGYSEVYLLDIKQGRARANSRFRRVCIAVLRRSETELFGVDVSESPQGDVYAAEESSGRWRLKGHWLEACNCEAGCSCRFGGFPDHGFCHTLVGISVSEGNFGNVDMAGVKAVMAIKWPNAIHEGNGQAALFVDESASAQQVEAVGTIFNGQVGGMPWEILATTLASCEGPVLKPIEMNVNGRSSSFRIPGILEASMAPLKNPVTGEVNDVKIVFPSGGLIWDEGYTATTIAMRVDYGEIKFEYPGQSAFFSPIEWTNHT